jgi:hypothetical protein
MRTTVTIDDDVYEAALAHSRATGQRLGKVLSAMARRALHQPAAKRSKRKTRFTGFSVPSDAPVITAAAVQKALDDEGIV